MNVEGAIPLQAALKTVIGSLACAAVLVSAAQAQTLRTTLVQGGFFRLNYVGSPPGDTARLFVIERDGKIKIIKNGITLPTPFLDIDALVLSMNREQGLLGLAFHPDYATNGKFYVDYTDNNGDEMLRQYTVSADPDVADAASFVDILGPIDDPQATHNAGCLAFGPDGYLYYSLGDGGAANDAGPGHAPDGNAQALDTYFGKLLRIDVDAGPPYVPASNPYASPTDGVLDLIWAVGLRNPWRFSFDRVRGDLYLGDVGQEAWEEIHFQPASSTGGENYGWRCMEGAHCTGLSGCVCDAPGLKIPIHEFPHGTGDCAVIGGYVYRGSAIAGLYGTYFFADYCSGSVWTFRYVNGVVSDFTDRTAELAPPGGLAITAPTSFGEDANGELYICDQTNGEVFRIEGDGLYATPFCAGDGIDPVVTALCPCTNFGAPGQGCANSVNSNGALLTVSGTTNPTNTLLVGCTGMPNNTLCTFLRGTVNVSAGQLYGDGVRCLGGVVLRFGSQLSGQNGNPPNTVEAPTDTVLPGITRYYHCYYRNPNPAFCPPGLFNVSNGMAVTW